MPSSTYRGPQPPRLVTHSVCMHQLGLSAQAPTGLLTPQQRGPTAGSTAARATARSFQKTACSRRASQPAASRCFRRSQPLPTLRRAPLRSEGPPAVPLAHMAECCIAARSCRRSAAAAEAPSAAAARKRPEASGGHIPSLGASHRESQMRMVPSSLAVAKVSPWCANWRHQMGPWWPLYICTQPQRASGAHACMHACTPRERGI